MRACIRLFGISILGLSCRKRTRHTALRWVAMAVAVLMSASPTAVRADDGKAASPHATTQATASKFEFAPWEECSHRILRKEVTVTASLDAVWRAWTTSEGMAEFFIPDTKIEMRPGGAYELYMGMAEPDESGLRGSEGCKLLSFIPREMLSFEWSFPPAVMNLRKARAKTIIVIRLSDLGDGAVKVDFSQLGWQEGEDWDKGYQYFDHAWDTVLGMLKKRFDERATEAESSAPAAPLKAADSKSWVDQHVKVTAVEGDARSQAFEMVIPASAEAVWNLLATTEGMERIGGKDPKVELKPGGAYAYWPGAPNKVMSYLPGEMLSTSGSAPPQFPNVRKGGTWSSYDLQRLDDDHTRLRLVVVGWRKGEEWDNAFDYFLKNNPIFLEQVYAALAYPVEVRSEGDQLEMTCAVSAPRAAVWDAFTTKAGMESWMVAHAEIDLSVGGLMRTHYAKEGVIGDANTIENIILSFEPGRMLSIKVGKPPKEFPFKESVKDMWTVIYLSDAGPEATRVRIVGMGYGADEEHQKLRAFFRKGNAWTLQRLQAHFERESGGVASDGGAQGEAPVPSSLQSYFAHLAAAGMAIDLGETAEAKRWLAEAPAAHRGWEWRYFKARSDQSDRRWGDIGEDVMFVAVRPGSEEVAAATTDGRVLIRGIDSGAPRLTLQAGDAALWHAAFSRDGGRICTSSSDGTARIWDAASGRELLKIPHEKTQVYSSSFSPDGKVIATCMLSHVKLWDAQTGEAIATLKGHVERPPVTRVVFSPDGRTLASSGWDNWVILWDVAKREVLHTLGPGYGGEEYTAYNAVEFSPDGRHVAAVGASGKVWVWSAASGELEQKWKASDKNIYAIAYSPDGSRIATGAMDSMVRIWSSEDGSPVRSFCGHDGMIRGLAFSRDGETLISGAADQSVRFWNLGETARPVTVRHSRGVWSARFSPDGSRLVTGGSDQAVRVWDSHTGEQRFAFEDLPEQVASVAFSPDGRFVAGGTNKPPVMVWDVESGEQVFKLEGHTGGIPGLAYSPDGTILVSASYDGTVRLWNARTGDLIRRLEGANTACHKAEFSPDGRILATAGKDGVVRFWDPGTGGEIAAMKGHESRLYCIAFSPDGRLLASSGTDRTVRIWDVASRRAVHVIHAHEDSVYGLAFTGDGSRLATGAFDRTIKLWDVETGLCAATIARTAEGPYDLSFSRGDDRLAVTYSDGWVEILDAEMAASNETAVSSRAAGRP